MTGETIVAEAKQSNIIYFWAWALGIVGVVVAALSFVLSPLALAVGALLVLMALVWGINIHGGRRYVLTTRRIIFKRGIINRHSLDLVLGKVEGVRTEQSLWGRMFGYGTVIVTTGEATNVYKWIKAPVKFATRINEQIAASAE